MLLILFFSLVCNNILGMQKQLDLLHKEFSPFAKSGLITLENQEFRQVISLNYKFSHTHLSNPQPSLKSISIPDALHGPIEFELKHDKKAEAQFFDLLAKFNEVMKKHGKNDYLITQPLRQDIVEDSPVHFFQYKNEYKKKTDSVKRLLAAQIEYQFFSDTLKLRSLQKVLTLLFYCCAIRTLGKAMLFNVHTFSEDMETALDQVCELLGFVFVLLDLAAIETYIKMHLKGYGAQQLYRKHSLSFLNDALQKKIKIIDDYHQTLHSYFIPEEQKPELIEQQHEEEQDE